GMPALVYMPRRFTPTCRPRGPTESPAPCKPRMTLRPGSSLIGRLKRRDIEWSVGIFDERRKPPAGDLPALPDSRVNRGLAVSNTFCGTKTTPLRTVLIACPARL